MDSLNLAVLLVALAAAGVQHALSAAPGRRGPVPAARWWTNAVLFAVTTATVTLLAAVLAAIPAALAGLPGAAAAGPARLGALPTSVQVALLLAAHSFLHYWLHRAMHHVPALWAFHRVHHADTQLDATTGLRHHPVDAVASLAVVAGLAALLAPTAGALVAYLLLTSAFAIFGHLGPELVPARVDRVLSRVIVTPRLHRLHHSRRRCETDSNFGDVLMVWDRLFGTFRGAGEAGPDPGRPGLVEVPDREASDPFAQLAAPFRRDRPPGGADVRQAGDN